MVNGVEECEVGYLLHRRFWRHGFATEAALACRDYAFRELRRRRVVSLVRPENAASQAVARRLGMEVVGSAPHAGVPHLVFAVSNPDPGTS